MPKPATASPRSTPRVAVLVVDWNAAELTRRCLSALAAQTLAPSSVIVIDNASTSPTWQQVRSDHPRLDLIRLPANRGFAAAENLGIALASDCDWIATVNPDAFPEPEWLETLVSAARKSPDHAFFASRQVQADDPTLLDGTGDVYAVSGLAWRRDHGQPAPGWRLHGDEVFGPCAAAALYRRDVLVDVGGFDESFFCYFEDVDLAFRLRLAGHRCRYVPKAVVHHVGSATSGRRSDFTVYHGHRNLVWTWLKNMPPSLVAVYWPHHTALTLVSLLHFGGLGQGSTILRAKRDALRGLPRVLSQRRAIQRRRRVGARELRRQMAGGWRALGVRRFAVDGP